MKKYILIILILVIFASSVSAMKYTRDVVDYVNIEQAIKSDFCRIENPDCQETIGGGVPADQTAECLREKLPDMVCLPETKEMIYGEMTLYLKDGGTAKEEIMIVGDKIYDFDSVSLGYYYINNDVYQGVDTSSGGYFAYKAGSSEKLRGVKHYSGQQVRILDYELAPYGWQFFNNSYFMIYYDKDGSMLMYFHLSDSYYKMSEVKKKVENKTWAPPPEPERPQPTPEEIPPKDDIETPLPPPPVYLPGMPDSADPNKTHVIPNCHSQGASICGVDEDCPEDKWIMAKEEKCCSVICTPVGREQAPGQQKNKTEENETDETEQGCINSGGTVTTQQCCISASNFPNTCLIGACGCSLENSKEVKFCNCGENKCFNGMSCSGEFMSYPNESTGNESE